MNTTIIVTVPEFAAEYVNRVTGFIPSVHTVWHPGNRRCRIDAALVPSVVRELRAQSGRLEDVAERRKAEAEAANNRYWFAEAAKTKYRAQALLAIAAKIEAKALKAK